MISTSTRGIALTDRLYAAQASLEIASQSSNAWENNGIWRKNLISLSLAEGTKNILDGKSDDALRSPCLIHELVIQGRRKLSLSESDGVARWR